MPFHDWGSKCIAVSHEFYINCKINERIKITGT